METIAVISTLLTFAVWVYLPCLIVYCAFTDTNDKGMA